MSQKSDTREPFERRLLGPGVRISAAALLLFAVAFVVAWNSAPPPLPGVVRLGTGPADGHYDRFGRGLREAVAAHRIDLELVPTAGSMENIRKLLGGDIDVGLVQSGNLTDAEAAQLETVATVFHELVLVVSRSDWEGHPVEGGRVAIGTTGSGAHALTLELLADQGIADGVPPGTRFVEVGGAAAVEALQAGEVDSAVFVTALDVPWARVLFEDPDLRVRDFAIAEAFTRHYPYLRRLVIPAGLIDLRSVIPPREVQVIATTASLVVRPEIHDAVIPLLIESARELLYQGGLLAGPEEFPSSHGVEAPLAREALDYFERGPSFFYRWLPFRWASVATRLTILLIPLLTLLYPLLRSAGPTYRWALQRRVYRYYRVLRRIEAQIDTTHDARNLAQLHEQLERVGDEIRTTLVPSRYGANLFALRAHHRLLLDRLKGIEEDAG